MTDLERVTITLPRDLVEAIDRIESNRSRFVLDAVRRELERRKREELRRSLAAPHVEAEEIAEIGFDGWAEDLLAEDAAGLVDVAAGAAVRWVPGEGWTSRVEEKSPADRKDKPTRKTSRKQKESRE